MTDKQYTQEITNSAVSFMITNEIIEDGGFKCLRDKL